MHIDHIAVRTFDLEKEKEFFLRYFNCTVNEKYANNAKGFSSYFITFDGGARVELMAIEGTAHPPEGSYGGLAHFAIDLGSREAVEKMTNRLEADGVRITGRPRITGDGYYESIFLDPEGNMIELISK
jgi:lactoylglutathione lyase